MKSFSTPLLASLSLVSALVMVPALAFACDGGHHGSTMFPANANYRNTPISQDVDFDMEFSLEDSEANLTLVIEEDIDPVKTYVRPGRRGLSQSFRYTPWVMNLRDDVRRIEHKRPKKRARRNYTKARSSKPELDSRRIARVLAALEDEPFSDGQLEIISEAGRRFDLTTRQAIRLVKHLSFDSDRVEALADLYPSITDQENFIEVYALLSFSSDRRDLRRRVGL